jgi:hypothetical protein
MLNQHSIGQQPDYYIESGGVARCNLSEMSYLSSIQATLSLDSCVMAEGHRDSEI